MAKTKTLADLAADAAEIERQKILLQLPVLQGLAARLAEPAVQSLIDDLVAAQGQLVEEHAQQAGFLITTLTNVPAYMTAAAARLDAIVSPPVMPTPITPATA